MSYLKKIKTKNGKEVILRGIRGNDVTGLLEYINRLIEEDTFISQTRKKTIKEEREYVRKRLDLEQNNDGVNILAEDEGKIIANGEITRQKERSEHVGLLGISISKGYRDEGLGTMILDELLRVAKKKMQLKIVYLTVYVVNGRALHVYKNKLGFGECGRMPEGVLYKGEFIDHVYLYKKL